MIALEAVAAQCQQKVAGPGQQGSAFASRERAAVNAGSPPLVVIVQTTRVRKVPHMRTMLFILATLFISSAASTVMADGPIIAFGEERDRIRNTPILERENRPFHFYGNTVRRMHARQQGLPMFRINSGSLLGR